MKNNTRIWTLFLTFVIIVLPSLMVLYHFLPENNKFPVRDIVAKINTYRDFDKFSNEILEKQENKVFFGKQILVIGDSQTAQYRWQHYLGHLLQASIHTHAKGGIGMVEMVDGKEEFPPLEKKEVENIDYILIMGLYNEMESFESNYGELNDMYPIKDSYCGKFNYMIKRICEELTACQNANCKIVLVGPHCFGKSPYHENDAYHYVGLSDSLNLLCNNNKISFCDIIKTAEIDSTNWDIYHKCGFVTNDNRANPNIKDRLHLNKEGQMKVAVAVSKYMIENKKLH